MSLEGDIADKSLLSLHAKEEKDSCVSEEDTVCELQIENIDIEEPLVHSNDVVNQVVFES